jgi:hypothetical protein
VGSEGDLLGSDWGKFHRKRHLKYGRMLMEKRASIVGGNYCSLQPFLELFDGREVNVQAEQFQHERKQDRVL